MLGAAVVVAESWGARIRAIVPADGRPLAPDEERFLFRVYARLTAWLRRMAATPDASVGEDLDARRAGMRYLEVLRMTVRSTLVKCNTGLVRKEAWAALSHARWAAHRLSCMELDDLVQEGQLGLMAAIDGFDFRRGVRFSTYARPVICRHIDRAIITRDPLVYLPAHALQSLGRIQQFARAYREQHGRVPSDDQISAATGVSLETLSAIYAVGRRVSERARDEQPDEAVWDRLPDANAVDALRALVSLEVETIVDEAMQTLGPLERDVVEWRFGLCGRHELSQAEIAHRTGMSQQRVVQIEARSLMKILIMARLRGIDAKGTGTLGSCLEVLADYSVSERDGLVMLQQWIRQSDRFCMPRYLRERLARLERLEPRRALIGKMLRQDPSTIAWAAAVRRCGRGRERAAF